jgi:hypothetical protein
MQGFFLVWHLHPRYDAVSILDLSQLFLFSQAVSIGFLSYTIPSKCIMGIELGKEKRFAYIIHRRHD